MIKRMCLTVLTAAIILGSSCPPQDGGSDNPDNILVPRLWSQIHANKEGTGFNAVHTQFALPALRKWTAPVGPSSSGFPVIGPDGILWVTNGNGELVAINPDGSERFRRKLDERIAASAAINPDTYEIFVVGQQTIDSETFDYVSHIFRLNSSVGLLAVSTEPLKTTAAPKLWRNFLFVPSGRGLKVFDQATLTLVGQVPDTNGCFNLVCGTFPDSVSEFFEFLDDCLIHLPCTYTPPSALGPRESPSVAAHRPGPWSGPSRSPRRPGAGTRSARTLD